MTIKYHLETSSAFFRLRTKVRLAKVLFTSVRSISALANSKDTYYDFKKKKKDGGFRDISAPRDDLKVVQGRIAALLQRIAPPDYLFAPVSGRSYVDNAAIHNGATSFRLLDIEDFFPKCTANKVVWFFKTRMQCSPDVAAIIRGLVTRDGCLPQGSPCSPILAYLCYIDMWEEIDNIVKENGCKLSVYADDLTISGDMVPEKAIWEIKQILKRHGHTYNRIKERSRHKKPAEITGVIVSGNRLCAPNRQRKKLLAVKAELAATTSEKSLKSLQLKVRGRVAQMQQIEKR